MSREFMHILQKYLMHIMFGTDIDDYAVVKLKWRKSSEEPYTLQDHTLSQAIEASFAQALDAIPNRMPNYFFFGGKFPFATT